jgi:predicted enzyme related to lactoylglutathione lyase
MTDERTDVSPALERQTDQGGFIWYELMTPDPEGSKTFYDAVVGWTIGEEGPPEYNGYRMIGRSDGGHAGGVLPLTAEMQQHGARPTWLGYIHVPDVDEKVAAIEAAGGKTWMAAMDIPNVGRVALLSDPQGAPFYVMKPIPPADDPNAVSDVFSPEAEQRVGWNELQTTDVDAARRFYGEQFGWDSSDFMDMGEMGQYRFFDHHGVRLGAAFNANGGPPARWRFYLRVPSVAAAKAVIEQKGGTVHMGPMQVPTGDYVLVGSDPQGAEFALVGKA